MDKIAIFLAVKNGEKYIKESIESVLNQSYQNFHLFIRANDCTDNTISIISDIFKENPNRNKIFLSTTPEPGKCNALNWMLKVLPDKNYKFIAIIDADDIWHPNKLEEQIKYTNAYDVIGTMCNYIDENKAIVSIHNPIPNEHDKIVESIKNKVNPLINSSVLIRTKFLNQFNGWDKEYEGVEDFYLWAQLAIFTMAKFININSPLVWHRLHINSHFNNSSHASKIEAITDYIDSNLTIKN